MAVFPTFLGLIPFIALSCEVVKYSQFLPVCNLIDEISERIPLIIVLLTFFQEL